MFHPRPSGGGGVRDAERPRGRGARLRFGSRDALLRVVLEAAEHDGKIEHPTSRKKRALFDGGAGRRREEERRRGEPWGLARSSHGRAVLGVVKDDAQERVAAAGAAVLRGLRPLRILDDPCARRGEGGASREPRGEKENDQCCASTM
jgi:hypothetical protein